MLTYAFDLLVLIYEEEGYAANDIPGLILKHNLHGIDLCPRAAQLAEMALVFKAREKSRRFFSAGNVVRPNIIELKNVRFDEGELGEYFKALGTQPSSLHPQLAKLLHQFEEAKTFGSLIQPCLTETEIQSVRSQIQNSKSIIENSDLMVGSTHLKILRVLDQAEVLSQRYHVVVANPPYMGGNGMNDRLKRFAKDNYASSKADLFAMFMERGFSLALPKGLLAMVTMQGWMFLSSYELLRTSLLGVRSIRTLIQIGFNSFPEMNSKVAQACAFVAKNGPDKSRGVYVNLNDADQASDKEVVYLEKLKDHAYFQVFSDRFKEVPGSPIAYWVSDTLLSTFQSPKLGDCFTTREGMATADNPRFLRSWSEVSLKSAAFTCTSEEGSAASGRTWFPYNKGGAFRRWYGNNELLVEYASAGQNIKNNIDPSTGRVRSHNYNGEFGFREGLTWSALTSGPFSIRYSPAGFLFDSKGAKGFGCCNFETLGFLNSGVAQTYLKILSPTLDYKVGDVIRIPWVKEAFSESARQLASDCVEVARADWDNFETSWDFRDQPLLRPGLKSASLEASWRNWEAQSTAAIRRMQELETENNRLFIAAYGLEGELQPEVPEEQITLARADVKKDMAAFLSYAVGCMMGRYSLARPGLVLADAGGTVEDYWRIVGNDETRMTNDEGKAEAEHATTSSQDSSFAIPHSSFHPDPDGILPVLDGEWFEDDIVIRTREFLRATFGEAALNENVQFIEQALGKDLRSYFQDDFFKNHLSGERAYGYKNRPIYWLFSSGKQKAFQCLVYLHRYTPGILSRIRTDYAIPLQGKLSARITRLEEEVPNTTSSAARKKLQTELDKAKKQLVELLAYDEQLRSYADQRIALDLDDGVKVNYAKFGPLVADAKKVCGKKED